MQNGKLSEGLAVVATIDPATIANTETFTDVVDMGANSQALAVALLGNMASETIDFKAYSCDSDGTNAAAISGRAATQLAAHASNNDAKQLVINLRDGDLLASGKQHVWPGHGRRNRRPRLRGGAGASAPRPGQRGRPVQRGGNRLTGGTAPLPSTRHPAPTGCLVQTPAPVMQPLAQGTTTAHDHHQAHPRHHLGHHRGPGQGTGTF